LMALGEGLVLVAVGNGDEGHLSLLSEFYHELILPTFEKEVELLDPFDTWKGLMMEPSEGYQFHADLLVNEQNRVIGGLMYEFYPQSLCGLLSYLVVKEEYRGRRLANYLIDIAKESLDRDAQKLTSDQTKKINAIFLETHHPPLSHFGPQYVDSVQEESLDIWTKRMNLFGRLGFQVIDVPYLQPPLEIGKNPAYNLFLLNYHPENWPDLSPTTLRDFLVEFNIGCGNEESMAEDYESLILEVQNLSSINLIQILTLIRSVTEGSMPSMMKKLLDLKSAYLTEKHD